MKVQEAMARTISTTTPDDTLMHAAELMRDEDCGFLPVVEGDRLVGVLTDRDIVVRCLAANGTDIAREHVARAMSKQVWTIDADADIEMAAHEMAQHAIRRLPVVRGSSLVGVLSYGNLEQAMHAHGAAAEEATLGVTIGA